MINRVRSTMATNNPLYKLIKDEGSYFNTLEYQNLLRMHKHYLMSVGSDIPVPASLAYKYSGYLFDLLDELNIPRDQHFAIQIANGFTSAFETTDSLATLFIPDKNRVALLETIWRSS